MNNKAIIEEFCRPLASLDDRILHILFINFSEFFISYSASFNNEYCHMFIHKSFYYLLYQFNLKKYVNLFLISPY